jgi:hypothetical protein
MAPTCEKNVQIKLAPKNFLLIIFNVVSVALFEKPLYKIIETKDCLTDIE